ncbi:MAG: AlpA family phage regulatory protein [Betaproteobacteria bacterium]|nr:AlpA family phage regulatory protein [Betaproteobacteria bacterium]
MQSPNLPVSGFLRQSQIIGSIVPVGASTLWRWVNAGTFPKPVKLSGRVTAWRCEDVRLWIDQQRSAGDKAAA